MLAARPLQTGDLFLLRPIAEKFLTQLPDLFNGPSFGGIRRAACRQRLIQHVRYRMKARQNVRAARHPLFQGAGLRGCQ